MLLIILISLVICLVLSSDSSEGGFSKQSSLQVLHSYDPELSNLLFGNDEVAYQKKTIDCEAGEVQLIFDSIKQKKVFAPSDTIKRGPVYVTVGSKDPNDLGNVGNVCIEAMFSDVTVYYPMKTVPKS